MRKPALVALLLATPLLAACTENVKAADDSGDSRTVSVTSTDDGCELSSAQAPSGTLTFDVTNDGSKVTEFYLLGEDGQRVVGEVENIGPGLTRNLVVQATAGSYVTACKPGMAGKGIRDSFTVTGGAAATTAADDAAVRQATDAYAAYVREQSEQLLQGTRQFVAAYVAHRDDEARSIYPQARMHWERIETVAESFGDLDPKMDLREADLEQGQRWTGWHLLEKDLWPPAKYTPLTDPQRKTYAADLLANT